MSHTPNNQPPISDSVRAAVEGVLAAQHEHPLTDRVQAVSSATRQALAAQNRLPAAPIERSSQMVFDPNRASELVDKIPTTQRAARVAWGGLVKVFKGKR